MCGSEPWHGLKRSWVLSHASCGGAEVLLHDSDSWSSALVGRGCPGHTFEKLGFSVPGPLLSTICSELDHQVMPPLAGPLRVSCTWESSWKRISH